MNSQTPADTASNASEPPAQPQIDFEPRQVEAMLSYARSIVDTMVRDDSPQTILSPAIDRAPAYGLFVTLRRASQLRACRGRWGGEQSHTLGKLLSTVATDAAKLDPRFAGVTGEELPMLALDVSLMFNPQPVTAQGEDRIDAVTVGRHGLVIAHPRGRGLLLPHVATDANWDSKSFLDAVCRKAGLPPDTWRRDSSAQLMTFEARMFSQPAPAGEFQASHLNGQLLGELVDLTNLQLRDQPAEPSASPVLIDKHDEELGLCINTDAGQTATAIGAGHSLCDLVEIAVRSLKDLCANKKTDPAPVTRITLLWQPILLTPDDYPDRHRGLANHAVLGRHQGRWSLALPRQGAAADRVGAALASLNIIQGDWKMEKSRLTAFSTVNFEARQRPTGERLRQPARAGQFYPGQVDAMLQAVAEHMAAGRRDAPDQTPQVRRAVMLPHAGWQFCGDTIAKTIARTVIPPRVIIIGPRHTPYGPNWSVASHHAWDLPGATVPIAADWAQYLTKTVPGLKCEPQAHREEHGSEVLIPFLHQLNPDVTVLPIVLGQSRYEATEPLAQALANICDQCRQAHGDEPLLVISSDMNHFAAEPENRRLDHIALDAMATGDPRKLYDTCVDNNISMCGFIPAAVIMQTLLKQSSTLQPQLIDYCNSAATTGDYSRVVGYAGVLLD